MKKRVRVAWAFLLQLDRSIVRGLSSILALRMVEKLSGFVLTVFLFRMLEKEQVAEYGFVQTVVAICAIFGIQEFQNAVSQSVARGFPGTYRRAVPLAFKWSIVGATFVAGFGAWYYWSGKVSLSQAFLIAAALFPVFSGLNQWKGVYLGEKDFTRFTMAEAGNAIVKALLIVAVMFAYPGSVLAPILVFFAVPASQNLWQSWLCHRRISVHAAIEEEAISYGLRTNAYSAIGIAANNIDRILIFTLLSPASLAIYMAAEKFADLLQSIVQDLGAVLAPKFSTIERYTSRLDNMLKLISLVMGVAIILFVIFALPDLVVLFYGPAYRESVLYAQVLVGAVSVHNIATLRFRFIRAKLDATSFRNILVVGSVTKIAASITLIPLFGLGGATASVFFHRFVLAGVIRHTIRTKYLNDANG